MTDTPRSPRPAGAPLRYFGSKWRLADWIVANLPAHSCYVEVFAGSASVLLRKPRVPVEYLNDLDGDLVCFFEVLRDRRGELARFLEQTPLAQVLIEGARPEASLARAAWVFQRSWGRFVGPPRSATFAVSAVRSPALTYERATERLAAVAERLRGVTISCLDFRELLERLDRPGVCFYCDPPYLGLERTFTVGFEQGDHQALAETIGSLRHARAAVSYAEHPRVYELYPQAAIFERHVRTFAGRATHKPFRTELLLVTGPPAGRAG